MKSKIKSLLQNNKFVLLSGLSSFFIIMVVYFCFSIIPFGDKTIYRMDLYHQYGPLFSELYDRVTSGESLLYSWNSGLGSSFIGNFYNYLSSPFSILVLIFGHENTFEAVAAMIAIKSILSAMSISYYLKKSSKVDGPQLIAFGIMYAFSAYFIAYYWNVMWIDSMYLLPLIVLGIEKIINSGKCGTYIIFLSLAIFTNYYIGFMLCIFSCLYFFYYYFSSSDKFINRTNILNNKDKKYSYLDKSFFFQSGLRFALSSFIVGIILLFMLLPVAYVLSSSSATSGTHPNEIKNYFTIFDFLANHLASLEPTIRSSGEDVLPNVYCGILTVILIPVYLFSDKISSKEKIASSILLGFMFFSFNINIFNYLWHGLHFPNDLPYRQSFMYSFILITMAYKAFVNLQYMNKKQLLSIGIGILAFIVLTQKLGSKNVDNTTILISMIYVFVFTIILGLIQSKKDQAYALSIILSCTVISETIIANTDHYVANQTKTAYTEDYDGFKELQAVVDEKDNSLFYRSELSDLRTRMDPSWYDYNGVSVFSSMAYESVANMQKNIGLYGNKINSYTYNPQTPVYNSFFGIKYVYDRNSLINEGDYYSLADKNATYSAYENNYNLNIAFPVSDRLLTWDSSLYSNPVDSQQELFADATGIDGIYNRIYNYELLCNNVNEINEDNKIMSNFSLYKIDDGTEASATATITAEKNGHIYIYVYSRNLDDVSIYSPSISTSMTVSDGYILDLGYYEPNDKISVTMPIDEEQTYANVDFVVFTIDNEKFVDGYNMLKSGQIEYTSFSDTIIEGNFSADNNEILFTSIPYDKGWNVYIDGEKVAEENIVKISDALLGVKVSSGEHSIKFKYSIPGLTIAYLTSCIFVILFLVILILKKKNLLIFKNHKTNIWEDSVITDFNVIETEEFKTGVSIDESTETDNI
jgi:uncharacterized membrane protein YfhO